jgi:tetratricopeptide (TPR) repeat protein
MMTIKINLLTLILSVFLLFLPLEVFSEEDEFEKGRALIKSRQYDEAIEAFSAAIETIPSDFEAYNYRGIARAYKKDYDGAIQDYTMALKIKPGFAEAFNNRGFVWVKTGNLPKALDDFTRAIVLEPFFLDAYNSKAWILATSSDDRYRNGKEALALAQKAVAIADNVDSLDTLAAAYAANGQFVEAVAIQRRTIELMIQQSRSEELSPYISHLEDFKAGRPLRISYAAQKTYPKKIELKKPLKTNAKRKAPARAKPKVSPNALGALPYTIQVSAYRDPKKSLEVATRLKDGGDPAFACPVYIPGKGEWNRVFIGFYQSLSEAKKAAVQLKKRKFHYAHVVQKPLAVQVGLADSYQEANKFKARLRGKGYMAYSLLERNGHKKTRILIGAYGTEEEAQGLIKRLRKDGFTARVISR